VEVEWEKEKKRRGHFIFQVGARGGNFHGGKREKKPNWTYSKKRGGDSSARLRPSSFSEEEERGGSDVKKKIEEEEGKGKEFLLSDQITGSVSPKLSKVGKLRGGLHPRGGGRGKRWDLADRRRKIPFIWRG